MTNNYIHIFIADKAFFFYIIITIATIALVIGSILSGLFYHLGGIGGKWWRSSWIRDWICPLILLATMQWSYTWHWSLYIVYFLMVGALSTYHKWLNPIFHQPKTDCFWFNWFAHGLVIGVALILYGYFTGTLDQCILRAHILGISMVIWSSIIIKKFKLNVAWDEWGRGALIISTLKLIGG